MRRNRITTNIWFGQSEVAQWCFAGAWIKQVLSAEAQKMMQSFFIISKEQMEKMRAAVDHAFNYNPKTDIKKLKNCLCRKLFQKTYQKMHLNGKCWKLIDHMGVNVKPVIFPDSALYPFNIDQYYTECRTAAAFDELTRTNRDDLIERQDKDFWPNSFRAARLIPAVEYINANRYRYNLCRRCMNL